MRLSIISSCIIQELSKLDVRIVRFDYFPDDIKVHTFLSEMNFVTCKFIVDGMDLRDNLVENQQIFLLITLLVFSWSRKQSSGISDQVTTLRARWGASGVSCCLFLSFIRLLWYRTVSPYFRIMFSIFPMVFDILMRWSK